MVYDKLIMLGGISIVSFVSAKWWDYLHRDVDCELWQVDKIGGTNI